MELGSRFDQALTFASQLHRHQVRKLGCTPYVGHLLRVGGIVLDYGGNEDEAIAALLHDALEDQNHPGLDQEIAHRFGDVVLQIVHGCSDTTQKPKPPWKQRKEQFLQRLRQANSSVRLVTAADKLDNVRSTLTALRVWGDEIWQRFHAGRDGSLWYYRQVVDVLSQDSENPLIQELAQAAETLARESAKE